MQQQPVAAPAKPAAPAKAAAAPADVVQQLPAAAPAKPADRSKMADTSKVTCDCVTYDVWCVTCDV